MKRHWSMRLLWAGVVAGACLASGSAACAARILIDFGPNGEGGQDNQPTGVYLGQQWNNASYFPTSTIAPPTSPHPFRLMVDNAVLTNGTVTPIDIRMETSLPSSGLHPVEIGNTPAAKNFVGDASALGYPESASQDGLQIFSRQNAGVLMSVKFLNTATNYTFKIYSGINAEANVANPRFEVYNSSTPISPGATTMTTAVGTPTGQQLIFSNITPLQAGGEAPGVGEVFIRLRQPLSGTLLTRLSVLEISYTAVPEPGGIAMIGMAGLLLVGTMRSHGRSRRPGLASQAA
jgi:hypothetical protein